MLTAPPRRADPDQPTAGNRPDRPGTAAPPSVGRGADAVVTALLTVLTLAAAAGFARVFRTPAWIVPVVATAVGVHLVSWTTRHLRFRSPVAFAVAAAAVGLLTAWTVVPGSLTFGLPLGHSWHIISAALQTSRRDFPTVTTPTVATTGFRLAAACGVGVVAATGDWLAFRARAGLQAAAPALALFVTCCIFGATRGRWWAVFLIVAATLAFWLAHRVLLGQARVVWFANLTGDATASTVAIGAGAAAVALLAALVVTPTLPSTEGQGVLGWRHGIGGAGGNRSVPTPIADLHTKLIDKSTLPAFTVRSPVPSYWRLTSLDTFTGQQWQSTDSYAGASGRLPGQPNLPARSIQSDFHIQNLDSIWMPTAFNPTAVSGGGQVSWDPVSDSLLASKATSDGLSYRLDSYQYLATLDPAQLDAAGSAPTAGMRPYLSLPSSVPTRVIRLASSIVSGAHTEYQKAKALQDYFQGPQFHYSLNPPDDGYGIDALSVFLFTTQTGYCQQFAGAYAVLARAVGLPTRLAVGFATGSPDSNGTFHVLDGDAHTWPEVYFKGIGWLPFEPTKAAGFQIPGATYTGNTAGPGPGSATDTPTTIGPAVTTPTALVPTRRAVPSGPAGAPAAAHHRGHGSALALLLAAAIALVAALGWAVVNLTARRVRWGRRRRRAGLPVRSRDPSGLRRRRGTGRRSVPGGRDAAGPEDASGAGIGSDPDGAAKVLVLFEEVAEVLDWWQIRRRADQTLLEFARDATRRLRLLLGRIMVDDSVEKLAAIATAASYGPDDLPRSVVGETERLATHVISRLTDVAPRSKRLERVVDPRLAWRAARVEPVEGWSTDAVVEWSGPPSGQPRPVEPV